MFADIQNLLQLLEMRRDSNVKVHPERRTPCAGIAHGAAHMRVSKMRLTEMSL